MTDVEYRKEKRKIAVPFFFKRKIFMVFIMLVCSGIMAVTATYAWFILATAPEVTGATTVVGANGSLEIALLNNETGTDLSKITADVGDSISVVGAVEGNVTWGNLVDVSDANYGLYTIMMYPAVLNSSDGIVDTTAMLSIPRNGVDGRIASISSNTMAALYNGTEFTTGNAKYGVRAIGSVGSGSNRSGALTAAKNSFSASQATALATAQSAVSANGQKLLTVAIGDANSKYTYNDVAGLQIMANGLKNSLNYILSSYKQAIIATAAANPSVKDEDFTTIRTKVKDASASELAMFSPYFPSGMSAGNLNELANSIADAEDAIYAANRLLYTDYGTDEQDMADPSTVYTHEQVSQIAEIIADTSTITASAVADNTLTLSDSVGGGLITAVADHAGEYSAVSGVYTIKATTTKGNGKGQLSNISLEDLTVPTEEENNEDDEEKNTIVTDFYGYVIDLAFRTNVAADLQMQSEAIDRIYTDGAGATSGGGTGVIYTAPAKMTDAQIESMLAAVRVVFLDPDTGAIYATGNLGEPSIERSEEEGAPAVATASFLLNGDGAKITDLEAVVPKKVSVLIYLDGTMLNNVSVFNAQSSGTLQFNFQFSSSADLKPMVDNELKNATSAEEYGG